MEREARARLRDLGALFEPNPQEARSALETLLDGPLTLRPVETADGKRYEVSGQLTIGPLFSSDGVPRGTRAAGEFSTTGVPKGIRTPVSGVKSRGPGPLDDGDGEEASTYRPEAAV
jgi:hypothetical protein